jgi:predicted AAA+ superfamily ATPase
MFKRLALKSLSEWSEREGRKPLVLRGARQVGKTSLVVEFSKQFPQFIHLNLENESHSKLFNTNLDVHELTEAIFFKWNLPKTTSKMLLFIDEIQYSANAMKMLRYFYEEIPNLRVIAAGSLLETTLHRGFSFPVGRVEFLFLRPASFLEFLGAIGEQRSIDLIQQTKVPNYAHETLSKLFHKYTLIGGMPEIVAQYAVNEDVPRLQKIFQGLVVSYSDDVEKYSQNPTAAQYLRHILRTGFNYAGQRIKFEQFGASNYRSREMGETFRLLEKTMLIELMYPITASNLPLLPNYRKSPKLQWLDIGLVNFMAKIQDEVFFAAEISDAWRGLTAEIVVGQELIAYNNDVLQGRHFWIREERNSMAEVDYIFVYKNRVIPVEVKSGSIGKLKSLHLYMEQAPHQLAVRIWSNPFSVEQVKTPAGKEFKLLNIPFYLISQIETIISNNL